MQGTTKGDLTQQGNDRRRFIKGVAVAGGAAVVTAGLEPAAASVSGDETVKSSGSQGYRETEHVRDYYKTASM
jgi:hypothetical protein